MMGGPRRAGVCVALVVVVVVAQVAAQARDDSLGSPSFIPRSNSRKFSSGHKIISSPALLREIARMKSKPGLSHRTPGGSDYLDVMGGVREDADGPKWDVGGHSYKLDEGSEREWVGPGSGYTGKAGVPLRGEATREGPRHFLGVSDGVEEEQMSEASGDERPSSSSIPVTNPDEDEQTSVPGPQLPAVPGDESASWSKEADLWRYREGEWEEVRLPDSSYPSLPTPEDPPAVAFVVATVDKVEVERRLEGLKNVTIHCRFYLSDSHHPDTLPELEVYFVNDGSRERLAVETIPGAWQEQNIQVPEADNSSIIIEGWLKAEGDIIALSNLYTTGVTPGRDEALDADLEEMTLSANTTGSVTSTLEAQGTGTEMTDQDNTTSTSNADNIQVDASQNPGEGNTEEGTDAAMPTDESEVGASTDVPESESRATAQVNGSMDAVTLNSSISSDDMTPAGNVSSDFKTTVTNIDAENNETGENSTIATMMDGDSGASENGTEEAVVTTGKEHDSTTASLPGVATDDLQTNASNTLPNGNSSATGGPLITTEAAVNSETPGGVLPETPFTDGQNLSTNVFTIDDTNSDTTLGGLESNTTSENVTGEAALPGEALMEPTPPSAGNSTEAVMAVPVSNTSWQVFQIFLVLCLMGLLALGFLYWKRKRRQDDEIPVFTRGTDYHNPTFTMEDAANFMSRGSRNTYKTIE